MVAEKVEMVVMMVLVVMCVMDESSRPSIWLPSDEIDMRFCWAVKNEEVFKISSVSPEITS